MSDTPTTDKSGTVRQERRQAQSKVKRFVKILVVDIALVLILSTIITATSIISITPLRKAFISNVKSTPMYWNVINPFFQKPKVVIQPKPNPEIDIIASYAKSRNSKLPIEVSSLIAEKSIKYAEKHNIAVPLIVGIMEQESTFNPLAFNRIPKTPDDTANGLMGVYQGETVTIDKKQVHDIDYNIDTGCKILNGKLDLNNGDLGKALSNYSGNAEGYTEKVMLAVGRYILYKWEIENPQKQGEVDIAIPEDVEVSMLENYRYNNANPK